MIHKARWRDAVYRVWGEGYICVSTGVVYCVYVQGCWRGIAKCILLKVFRELSVYKTILRCSQIG